MEWRFLAGYLTGACMIVFLQYLDAAWWMTAILAFVGYGLTQGIAYRLFDK